MQWLPLLLLQGMSRPRWLFTAPLLAGVVQRPVLAAVLADSTVVTGANDKLSAVATALVAYSHNKQPLLSEPYSDHHFPNSGSDATLTDDSCGTATTTVRDDHSPTRGAEFLLTLPFVSIRPIDLHGEVTGVNCHQSRDNSSSRVVMDLSSLLNTVTARTMASPHTPQLQSSAPYSFLQRPAPKGANDKARKLQEAAISRLSKYCEHLIPDTQFLECEKDSKGHYKTDRGTYGLVMYAWMHGGTDAVIEVYKDCLVTSASKNALDMNFHRHNLVPLSPKNPLPIVLKTVFNNRQSNFRVHGAFVSELDKEAVGNRYAASLYYARTKIPIGPRIYDIRVHRKGLPQMHPLSAETFVQERLMGDKAGTLFPLMVKNEEESIVDNLSRVFLRFSVVVSLPQARNPNMSPEGSSSESPTQYRYLPSDRLASSPTAAGAAMLQVKESQVKFHSHHGLAERYVLSRRPWGYDTITTDVDRSMSPPMLASSKHIKQQLQTKETNLGSSLYSFLQVGRRSAPQTHGRRLRSPESADNDVRRLTSSQGAEALAPVIKTAQWAMLSKAMIRAPKELWLRTRLRLQLILAILSGLEGMWQGGMMHCDSHFGNIFFLEHNVTREADLLAAKRSGLTVFPHQRLFLSDTSLASKNEIDHLRSGMRAFTFDLQHLRWIDSAQALGTHEMRKSLRHLPPDVVDGYIHAPCGNSRGMPEDIIEMMRSGIELVLGNKQGSLAKDIWLNAAKRLPTKAGPLWKVWENHQAKYSAGGTVHISNNPTVQAAWMTLFDFLQEYKNNIAAIEKLLQSLLSYIDHLPVIVDCRQTWKWISQREYFKDKTKAVQALPACNFEAMKTALGVIRQAVISQAQSAFPSSVQPPS